jgi:acyl-CoA thioesterase-2
MPSGADAESHSMSIGLAAALSLVQVDTDTFRPLHVPIGQYIAYGGEVVAQAVRASALTVPEGWMPHSLHTYFLRPGTLDAHIVYHVERIRDGGSFAIRRITAEQNGKVQSIMSVSLSRTRPTDSAAPDRTDLPEPARCVAWDWGYKVLMEGRVAADDVVRWNSPLRFWVRPIGGSLSGPAGAHAAVAYMTDLSTGLSELVGGEISGGTLDHSVWFHAPTTWSDWLHVEIFPGTFRDGRGWYHGEVHDESGYRVASFTQEALAPHKKSERVC